MLVFIVISILIVDCLRILDNLIVSMLVIGCIGNVSELGRLSTCYYFVDSYIGNCWLGNIYVVIIN